MSGAPLFWLCCISVSEGVSVAYSYLMNILPIRNHRSVQAMTIAFEYVCPRILQRESLKDNYIDNTCCMCKCNV